MKRILHALLLLSPLTALSQAPRWQQRTDYTINVTLDTAARTLEGFERLFYVNRSPDTIRSIPFHLWPNAYKSDRSTYTEQALRNGDTRFYFSNKEQRGYINRLDFRVNGLPARTTDHPEWIDVIYLQLPAPLAPGASAAITTPFHVKLPAVFSRSGYAEGIFCITQWYPKPAVYDARGWHPMPYLDQGEFYSEFGSFDVTIHAPSALKVAATGVLQDAPLLDSLRKGILLPGAGTRSWRFRQDSIHDFAWFASKRFKIDHDTARLRSGRVVDVFTYGAGGKVWSFSKATAKAALQFYSAEVGEYPYDVLTVVKGPDATGGGMEYPTICVVEVSGNEREAATVIAHEVGHNWFYGILANNERDEPWMDEGINSFYERKFVRSGYARQPAIDELLFQTLARQRRDQPMATPADSMSALNYELVTYYKTARWLEGIEKRLGSDSFRQRMQDWYRANAFRHVTGDAFTAHITKGLSDSGVYAAQLHQTGPLPGQQLTGTRLLTLLNPKGIGDYLRQPTRNAWLATPAIGGNRYDGLLAGALITNYGLPPARFRIALTPMYGFRWKALDGIGRASYTVFPKRGLKRVELFATGSTFSYNEFETASDRVTARFYKIAPGLEIEFRQRDPRSSLRRTLQWKSYFLGEQPFRIGFVNKIVGPDTLLELVAAKRSLEYAIHQLQLRIDNNRALYPYRATVSIQASDYFARIQAEGSYFFNYAKGGGLDVRVFAGKLFYDENRTSYPYGLYPNRYFLQMSGVSGEEDYTYSNYYIGRSAFEGLSSQQIAIRDGGFKMRTGLLAQPVGQSDNWLAAINLNTTIPDRINPLSILPVKIPLHLFADIGTYSAAWEPGADTDRFLYEAGLHLPLFHKLVNLYFPVIYSNAFSDYARSIYPKNRFFKTMTFSIDLASLSRVMKNQTLF